MVAAQCELPALRDWPAAQTLTARIGVALRAAALDLQHLSLELLTSAKPRLPPGHAVATDAMRREAARLAAGDELEPEQRAAAEATVARLLDARRHIGRLEHAVTDDAAAAAAIGGVDLSAFAPRRNYDPRQLATQFRAGSPVLRFAVRLSAAMVAGALIAQTFGGAGHGNWVLLTIAVIMRASYGWTRARRNDRIVGTLIGCVVASLLVGHLPVGALVLVQGAALALTHGFVRSNYRLASVGASVMALVSLHSSTRPRRPRRSLASSTRWSARRSPISSATSGRAGNSPRRRGWRPACSSASTPSPRWRCARTPRRRIIASSARR